MVLLEKVDPRTPHMDYSLDCFRSEHRYYDCIEQDELAEDYFMRNLDSAFHTYMITDHNREWLGYILLYNREAVNNYIRQANFNALMVLLEVKFTNYENRIKAQRLESRINAGEFLAPTKMQKLDEAINEFADEKNEHIMDLIWDYHANNCDFYSEETNNYHVEAAVKKNRVEISENIPNLIEAILPELPGATINLNKTKQKTLVA